jgi:hypothetical protein
MPSITFGTAVDVAAPVTEAILVLCYQEVGMDILGCLVAWRRTLISGWLSTRGIVSNLNFE